MPEANPSTIIPTQYQATWRGNFERETVWVPDLVEDYSMYFTMGGTKLEIPIDFTNYGPANEQISGGTTGTETAAGTAALQSDSTDEDTTSLVKTAAASLAWQDPNLVAVGKTDLEIDQQHDVRILVDYWREQRLIPSYVGRVTERITREMAVAVNRYIRDTIFGGADNYTLASAAMSTTAGNWGNEAHLAAIYKALREAALHADAWQWPNGGRSLVVGPAIYDLVVEDLVQRRAFVTPSVNDMAYISGETPGVRGWTIRKDKDIAIGRAATDDDNHRFYFLSERMGIGFASDINRLRTFEAETFKGWLTQGVQSWGAKVLNPRYQFKALTTITA